MITQMAGPTTPIGVAGWRLLTDPTFDPPAAAERPFTAARRKRARWLTPGEPLDLR